MYHHYRHYVEEKLNKRNQDNNLLWKRVEISISAKLKHLATWCAHQAFQLFTRLIIHKVFLMHLTKHCRTLTLTVAAHCCTMLLVWFQNVNSKERENCASAHPFFLQIHMAWEGDFRQIKSSITSVKLFVMGKVSGITPQNFKIGTLQDFEKTYVVYVAMAKKPL